MIKQLIFKIIILVTTQIYEAITIQIYKQNSKYIRKNVCIYIYNIKIKKKS